MHRFYPDLGDLQRPSRTEKVLDYLTAVGISLALFSLITWELCA